MFRRDAPTQQDESSKLGDNSNIWGSLMDKMEDTISKSLAADAASSTIVAQNASSTNDYSSVMEPPGLHNNTPLVNYMNNGVTKSLHQQQKLSEWIQMHKFNGLGDITETRTYYERCVYILNSLVLNVVFSAVTKKAEMELQLAVHPELIAVGNIMIHQSIKDGEAAYLIRTEIAQDSNLIDTDTKYAAMRALGTVAYQLLTRGAGPPISAFLPPADSRNSNRLLLQLDDVTAEQSDTTNQAKRQRGRDETEGRIVNAMLNARVPYPLCRLTADLLGGGDDLLFRSDNAFQSFSDILADLGQMMANPEAFVHLSVKGQSRLAFGDKILGRETEMEIIMDVASRVTGLPARNDPLFEALDMIMPQGQQQVIMVHGPSGSGKTRLVLETTRNLEEKGWCRLYCKFDRIVYAKPLSIIAGAFNQFLEQCLSGPNHVEIGAHLKQITELDGIKLLSKHIPCILRYLDEPTPSLDGVDVDKMQLHHLFYQLLNILSLTHPITFFVDDLQWADAASLELLLALSDSSESNLPGDDFKSKVLLIGSYRDNEVDLNSNLKQMLDRLRGNKSVKVTNVAVNGFRLETLNKILSEYLYLPARRTKSLSEIILQKTDGIVIHMLEFLQRLVTDKILFHSLTRGWAWDCEVIESYPISDSVAELFILKLKTFPPDALLGLQICSIFGGQIEQRIIDLVHDYDGDRSADMNAGLAAALDLKLVEETSSKNVFKFAHDIIAETAIGMIPDEERPKLLRKLALSLIRNASATNELNSVIFIAVDLINRIPNENILDKEERALYARINNTAAAKALSVPDFSSAVKYSEAGLSFLDANHWQCQHNLSIELYNTSVAALHSCSNSNQDIFKERMDAIFDHANCIDEEFKARCIWIRLKSFISMQTAINESHNLLDQLEERIDQSNNDPTFICSELTRAKKAFLTNMQQHQFSSLTRHSCNKTNAIKVMSSLVVFYHYQRSIIGGLVSAKMVEISMEFGYREESVSGLAFFAFHLVSILGDIDGGCMCARMSLSLLSKCHNANALLPSVYAAVYGLVLIWKEPIQATLEPILNGCRLGFHYGNIFFAAGNAQIYVMRSYLSGKKIDLLLKQVEILARQFAEHSQISFVQNCLTPVYNVLRNMAGFSPQVLRPLKNFIDNDELIDQQPHAANQIGLEMLLILTISQTFYLRDFDKAQKMVELFADVETAGRPVFNYVIIAFYSGLTACHFGRLKQDPNWQTKTTKHFKHIERALSHSKWNIENKQFLLLAEYHYTIDELDKAAKYYKESITSARNHKFLHEEALAAELAGHFHESQGDHTEADEMFKRAYDAYSEWGAVKKAQALLKRNQSAGTNNIHQL